MKDLQESIYDETLEEDYTRVSKYKGETMKLKDVYGKLYKNVKRGEYDVATVDENTFKMKTSISFIDLLKDCDKEGVNIESFLKYIKEQEEGDKSE